MPKKLTQEQVAKEFTDKGCQLLEQYVGNQKSMKYRCKCGEISQTCLVGFRKSDGCYKCSEASAGRKFTFEKVKQHFLDQGCELLDSTYERSVLPLNYRCACGHISKMDFGNFRKGRRCQKCKAKQSSDNNRTSDEIITKICEQHNCQYIRSWIERKKTKIEYICKCGRNAKAYLTNFKKFPNCWECGKLKKSGANCYMYDPDRDAVKMRKKFRKICGQHIHRFMKATQQKKTRHTHELLGYRPKDLQEHILNHPNMVNCSGGQWHVDHIFPIQAFLDHKILDLKKINHLSNLRPMPGEENLSKADKYDEKEFEQWLGSTGSMDAKETKSS